MARDDGLLAYAERVLGRCEAVEDCSWGHGWSVVLRLRDAAGTTWFVKRHRDRERYDAEVTAYQRWVPALGEQAARLRAHDAAQAIVLSALPGRPAPWPERDIERADRADRAHCADRAERVAADLALQRSAGALLRRLHGAQPAVAWDDFGAAKTWEFDRLAPQAAGLLTARELGAARAGVRALCEVGVPQRQVPCHRDYSQRNWLVDDDGGLRVIDFEWARPDVWVTDLIRLSFGAWQDRPDLQEAFLDGYGRRLSDADRAVLTGCSILTAVWLVVKARESAQGSFEQSSRLMLRRLIGKAA
ncbi:MAG TPA: aminoglycoside phosphotransferase family protein [Actinocrinis sp.]